MGATTTFPVRTYEPAGGSLAITDLGAQVLEWTPRGGSPVIFRSAALDLSEDETSITVPLSDHGRGHLHGGIPLVFPWFGPGRDGDKDPIHGFARRTPWNLVLEASDDAGVRLVYSLSNDDVADDEGIPSAFHQQFGYPFDLEYEVLATAESLKLSLTVTNLSDESVTIEEALHPYLSVGDVAETTLSGLDGRSYIDKTDNLATKTISGDVTYGTEVDAVVSDEGPVITLTDAAGGRRLVLSKSGSGSTVTWNPGPELAARLVEQGQLTDGEWTTFVCVEAANAFDAAPTLAAGESHTLSLRITADDAARG